MLSNPINNPLGPTIGAFNSAFRPLGDVIKPLLSGTYTIESDGKINLGQWTDSRAASLWLPDHEGVLREVPGGMAALVDPDTGRTPRWDGADYWATDSSGNPLPSYGEWGWAHYPASTNYIRYTEDVDLLPGACTRTKVGTYAGRDTWEVAKASTNLNESINTGSFTNDGASIYYARLALWAGTSTQCSIGINTGSWAGNLSTKVSGPGTVINISGALTQIENLDPVTPTIVEITLDASLVSGTTTRLFVYPDKNTSSTIGKSIVLQFYNLEPKLVTPLIKTYGAPVSRDACSINHPYADYFSQPEGTLIFDWAPLHDAEVLSAAEGLFSVSAAASNVLYLGTALAGEHKAADGTNTTSVAPGAYASGDAIRAAVRWSTSGNELQTGVQLNGSWTWSSATAYDGAFDTSSLIHLFYGLTRNATCKAAKVYNKALTTTKIEALA